MAVRSISGAITVTITLTTAIHDEGAAATESYLTMLADYPLTLLQRAGVDLTTAAPIQAALDEFARTVTAMEQLVDAGGMVPPATASGGASAGV